MFTLASYVKEPVTKDGLLKYNSFGYPFGDYVFYTDNTPLFSVPFKWFCHHIIDLSKYTVGIFQLWIVSNIVVCSLLVFYAFRRILRNDAFSFLAAIVLPWTNVQILGIIRGHFNLSLSSLVLLAICLLLLWDQYQHTRKKYIAVMIGMMLLSVVSFLAHIYYLPIITIFITVSLFFYGLYRRKTGFGKLTLVMTAIYPAIVLGISLLTIFASDKYLALRKAKANGYDWMEQKMRFTSLLSHYYFEKIYFPFPGLTQTGQTDKPGYLGNLGLFGLFFLIILLFNKACRTRFITAQKEFFRDPLKSSVFFGSLLMLIISFGEIYYTAEPHDKGLRLVNVLNPFLYIHFFTDRVEQFRFLGRFMWPFYFGFYVWVLFSLVETCRATKLYVKRGIAVALLLLGGAEVFAFGKEIHRLTVMENILNHDNSQKFIPQGLHPEEFQAILPIPYYFTGVEDPLYDYNIDGDPDWVNQTYSLSAGTGLPLMSSNMSRTPRIFAERLMNFVAYNKMDAQLSERLNDKPLLVAVNKDLINRPDARNIPANKLDAQLYWGANQFITRNRLQAFDSAANIVFYKWYPK